MKILAWLRAHIFHHRPLYFWLPAAAFLVWLLLTGYSHLSGRAPIDDAPIGALWNLIGLVLVVVLTRWTKPALFDDIDTRELVKRVVDGGLRLSGAHAFALLGRVLIDSAETVFLLCFFAHFLFRA